MNCYVDLLSILSISPSIFCRYLSTLSIFVNSVDIRRYPQFCPLLINFVNIRQFCRYLSILSIFVIFVSIFQFCRFLFYSWLDAVDFHCPFRRVLETWSILATFVDRSFRNRLGILYSKQDE